VDSALIRRKLAHCSQQYKSAKVLPIKPSKHFPVRRDLLPIAAIPRDVGDHDDALTHISLLLDIYPGYT
jgi:hypothetical protein